MQSRLHVSRRSTALRKFRPANPRRVKWRVEVRAQKILGGGLLLPSALPGSVNQKCAVEQHQARRNSRERRRPATACLTAVQFTPRAKVPAFTSASRSAAVAFAGG